MESEFDKWMGKDELNLDEVVEVQQKRVEFEDRIYRLYKDIVLKYQNGETEHPLKKRKQYSYIDFYNFILKRNPYFRKILEWEYHFKIIYE